MQEKKLLSIEEIESQTLLDLPDRPAMQVVTVIQTFLILIFNLGGGGAGGSSGGGGGGGAGGGSNGG
jgi:hypothetical protein